MKIYRKVVPKIAKDVIRTLLASKYIEIEDGHRDEAEMDVAASIVEYLNAVDQLKNDARDALERHKLPPEMLGRVKKSLAESRKIVVDGDEAVEFLLNKIINGLFESRYVIEVFAEDNEIRGMVHESLRKYLGVDEELDREVRGRLKNFREGTLEWETEYGRLIEQMRSAKLG